MTGGRDRDSGAEDPIALAVAERVAAAVRAGELVVYPTETVYGLGADALDPAAVERVFEVKRRDRGEPVSLAVPSVAATTEYTRPTDRERAFMNARSRSVGRVYSVVAATLGTASDTGSPRSRRLTSKTRSTAAGSSASAPSP